MRDGAMNKIVMLLLLAMTTIAWNGCSDNSGNPAGAGRTTGSSGWTLANTGITTTYIFDFGVSGNTILAGGLGLFRSTDDGAYWMEVDRNIPQGDQVTCFATAPSAAGDTVVFAGVFPFTEGKAGVYRSLNGGLTWTPSDSGLTNTEVECLASVRTATGGTDLFAGTLGGGIFRSTDGGLSWSAVNSGLSDLSVASVACAGTTVFASTGEHFYRSTDYGESWHPISNGFSSPANTLPGNGLLSAANGTSEPYLFGGAYTVNPDSEYVLVSTNGGASWTSADAGWVGYHVNAFAVPPAGTNDGAIFAGTFRGVYTSDDNGTTWAAIDSGLTLSNVYALTVHDNYVFASLEGGGVFRRPIGK